MIYPDPCAPQRGTIISEGTPAFTTVINDYDVKAALRIDDDTDDALIANLIAAVVPHLEATLNTRFAQRTVVFEFPYLSDKMVLPLAPITAINGTTYLDITYNRQTLDTGTYQLVQKNGYPVMARRYNTLFPNLIWEDNSVQVTCTVGYADQASIPEPLKQALIVMVADQYRNPDRPLTATTNVDWLIAPFRKGEWLA